MTYAHSWATVNDWLSRSPSLEFVLAAAAVLTFAKATLLVTDLSVDFDITSITPIDGVTPSPAAPTPPQLDEEQFVPWPSVLPEPAAGPGGENSVSDEMIDNHEVLDPTSLTKGERQALQQLMARRKELDNREQQLEMRAELNMRAETRLDEQIEKLTSLRNELASLVKNLDEAEERKLARLVKIYETMKPKAAAEIFNRLDIKILIHVIERMKEAKSAAVLGKMDPAVAKRITTELAKKKERPVLDES